MITADFLVLPLLMVALVLVMAARRRPRRWSLPDQLRAADEQLSDAARAARRQMNDAAGQSWRNLAE